MLIIIIQNADRKCSPIRFLIHVGVWGPSGVRTSDGVVASLSVVGGRLPHLFLLSNGQNPSPPPVPPKSHSMEFKRGFLKNLILCPLYRVPRPFTPTEMGAAGLYKAKMHPRRGLIPREGRLAQEPR
jgi:hypothetical protein